MSQTDLIIVGAGPAGCVLARQLAIDHGIRVTLIEAPSGTAPRIDRQRPSRWLKLLGSAEDWGYRTEPQAALANRPLAWPRGRGLGGSSRINAMIWFPPTESEWRTLQRHCGGAWTRAQWVAATEAVKRLVRPERPSWLSNASREFLATAADLPQATPMIYRRLTRGARRWNPASLIRPPIRRPAGPLPVAVVRSTVQRVLWDGDRAIGVRCVDDHGDGVDLHADHGVVLCGGAIATPSILMRSGIGPPEVLAAHRVDLRRARPEVGQNLQDHLIMPVIFRTRPAEKVLMTPPTRELARWQIVGAGPVGSNLAECGGLFVDRSLQVHVTPTHYLTFPRVTDVHAMTIGVSLTRPASRGSLRIGGPMAGDAPCLSPEYLSDPEDQAAMIRSVRWVREVVSRGPLCDFVIGESTPGYKRTSDEAIARAIARYSQTLYHPVGTCRCGTDPNSVVDPSFAVRQTERLWVVDASLLPQIPVGNPVATVMTWAMLAAERIGGKISQPG